MKILAYRRPDGRVGIRNHVVVIPTSVCASVTAVRIGAGVPGTVAIPHQHGCCQVGADYEQTVRTLAGVGRNPNVAAVLVVNLGCENINARQVAERIAATGKPVRTIGIQETGGVTRTVEAGIAALSELLGEARRAVRTECDLADIVLGLECGGSDATSGLAANPVLGLVSDRLVAAGGTSVLSETTELIGAEHLLARRARSAAVAERLLAIVARTEQRARDAGVDLRGSQPTPGNIEGGITTIEEKSLGCVYKAGRAPLEGVLEYAEEPPAKGLYMMDTPGQDIESITGMVAGGAQVVVFTTGRGSPTGCPIAPVIKVTGNAETYRRMEESMDINAGAIVAGEQSPGAVAAGLFDCLVACCNGRETKAERLGHGEFAIHRVGYTF